MKRTIALLALAVCLWPLWQPLRARAAADQSFCILTPPNASGLETLAAREVRRYLYLRTGRLAPILQAQPGQTPPAGAIVVARKDRPLAAAADPSLKSALAALRPQQYLLKTIQPAGRQVLLLAGGDEAGTLYAAYRFAERLGVRFYLHGDVVPDERISLAGAAGEPSKGATRLLGSAAPAPGLPVLDELGAPLFTLRGIQPFHDFPEGPDWWNRDDYLAIISQLPKLRMNFFGLHTYPEGAPNAEPTVWIGPPNEIGANGQVKSSYPSSYQNTLRGNWGYAAKKTSDFVFGAAALFEHDAYGPDVMLDHCPQPAAPEACNEVFQRAGALLHDAFQQAHQLGVQTCVGTETPLKIPKPVAERLKAQGKDPASLATVAELYQGMFTRAAQTYHIDYYWFWTPEGWTWEATKDAQVAATTNDLFAAIAAAKNAGAPFRLATCGWVLGPQQDRALFDQALPKDIAVSCINREVGRTPVDPAFAKVSGRSKWAIPWLEDDPALTSPQLWVGRMRRDAWDARRYGCDGLMGIHWRTRVLGPAVSALAQAAWEQGEWAAALPQTPAEPARSAGAVGGQYAAFTAPIANTEEDPVYQTVRWNVSAYHLPVPNGAYKVTLKFCEPHYQAAGKRVFGVKLQGRTVIEHLDIFAKVGPNVALDYPFDNIAVTNGWLDIDFVPEVEFPSIAGIVVQGANVAQKINCGGPAFRDYAADYPVSTPPKPVYPKTTDFYQDWAMCQFGSEVAAPAAAIFARIDGNLPRPSDWINGPGGIRPDARPWEKVSAEYAYVDEFAGLRSQVRGAGNQERFDYWLNTFRYMQAMARLNCRWAVYNDAFAKVKAEKDPAARQALARQSALPLRRQLVRELGQVYAHLLALVSNPGELGTVANWEQHLLPDLLAKPGAELASMLGEELPADAQAPKTYRGPTRVIVPTVRASLAANEPLILKVFILSEQPPRDAALYWRALGSGKYEKAPLTHVARGVYSAKLSPPPKAGEDVEYHIKVMPAQGQPVYFPATAPEMNQTVVVGAAP